MDRSGPMRADSFPLPFSALTSGSAHSAASTSRQLKQKPRLSPDLPVPRLMVLSMANQTLPLSFSWQRSSCGQWIQEFESCGELWGNTGWGRAWGSYLEKTTSSALRSQISSHDDSHDEGRRHRCKPGGFRRQTAAPGGRGAARALSHGEQSEGRMGRAETHFGNAHNPCNAQVGDSKTQRLSTAMVEAFLDRHVLIFDRKLLKELFEEADYKQDGSLGPRELAAAFSGGLACTTMHACTPCTQEPLGARHASSLCSFHLHRSHSRPQAATQSAS